MSGIPPSCSYRKDYHFFVLKTESVIWASFRKQGSEKSLKNHPPTDSPKIHIPLPYENVGEIRWSLKTWTQKWYEYWRLPAGKVRKMYNHKSWLETTNLDLGWIKEYVHQADLDICTSKTVTSLVDVVFVFIGSVIGNTQPLRPAHFCASKDRTWKLP